MLPNNGDDERVRFEVDKALADTYFFFLAVVVVVTVIQLFSNRTLLVYLPAIIGGGGSLLFFLVRYMYFGLFNRNTDERAAALKIQTKAICYSICFFVHIIGGAVLPFFDIDGIGWVFVSWFIPSIPLSIHIIKKGLLGSGSVKDTNKSIRVLRFYTPIGALFFGVFTAWPSFDAENIGVFVRGALIMAVVWGLSFYFMFAAALKLSDKLADKRVAKEDEKDSGKDE